MLLQQLPGTLLILAAAVVCGIIASREKPARISAWVSGALLVMVILQHA